MVIVVESREPVMTPRLGHRTPTIVAGRSMVMAATRVARKARGSVGNLTTPWLGGNRDHRGLFQFLRNPPGEQLGSASSDDHVVLDADAAEVEQALGAVPGHDVAILHAILG